MTSCYQTQVVLESAGDKLADQLEITNLLFKVNSTYAMMKKLMHRRHRDYLKYHDDLVIDLDEQDQSEDERKNDNSDSMSSDQAAEANCFSKKIRDAYGFHKIEKAFLFSVIDGLSASDKQKE